LDKLAEADLIERRELAHDRRYKTVLLSAKAKERIPEFQDVLTQVRYDFLTNVDEEDLEVCLRVFDRLLSHSPKD
jgi:MarR family transcriptional regulator for hemolysin